jgi:hypothetical protein
MGIILFGKTFIFLAKNIMPTPLFFYFFSVFTKKNKSFAKKIHALIN